MKMYCRDCGSDQKIRIEKDKNIYRKEKRYFCKNCGVRLLTISSNRRKDLR